MYKLKYYYHLPNRWIQWFWIPVMLDTQQLPDSSDYGMDKARSWGRNPSYGKQILYPILPLPMYQLVPSTRDEERETETEDTKEDEEELDETAVAEEESKRELLRTKAKVSHKPISSNYIVPTEAPVTPTLVSRHKIPVKKKTNGGKLIIENLGRSHKVMIYPLSDDSEELKTTKPVTKIILKPVSKAIAGTNGTAIASPISKAIVRRGDYVEIDYAPKSMAVVGNGGTAQSEPQLIITFQDRKRRK